MTYAGMTKDQIFAIQRKALMTAQEQFVLGKFTDKEVQPTQSGNTLKMHYYDNIDEAGIHDLAEGVTPAATELVRVPVQGVLKRQGAWVATTDELMEQHENASELHKETSTRLGYLVGIKLEKDAFAAALGGAGTSIPFTGIDADLALVRKALRTANAPRFTSIKDGSPKVGTTPVNAGWYGFFSLNDADLVRAASDFISVEDYGYSSDIAPNEIGAIKSLGLRIIETTNMVDGEALFLGEGGLGSLDLSGKNGIEYINKALGESGEDQLNQRGSIGAKSRTGAMVLMADRVVKMATA